MSYIRQRVPDHHSPRCEFDPDSSESGGGGRNRPAHSVTAHATGALATITLGEPSLEQFPRGNFERMPLTVANAFARMTRLTEG